MLSRCLALLVWSITVAWGQEVAVREAQPYSEVLSAIAGAQENVTLLVTWPDSSLLSALSKVAPKLIPDPRAVAPDLDIRRETARGDIYFVYGPRVGVEAADVEAYLRDLGVQVRSLPADFPEALITVDFATILAANVPEGLPEAELPPLSSLTWEIVSVPEMPESVIKDLSRFWEVAQQP